MFSTDTIIITPYKRLFYWITVASLLVGLGLSILSMLNLCTEACASGHKYRLYGFKFEYIGIIFFVLAIILQLISWKLPPLRVATASLIAGGIGAEGMFIYAQKYIIGHWCPICLGIASTVFVAFIPFVLQYFLELKESKGKKGEHMKNLFKGFSAIILITLGFFVSQIGFAKFNKLQAAEQSIKENIAFGDLKSPIEVYVFTDWECPSCRKVEPVIEENGPKITAQAKLIFVDLPVHEESMNFTPYNLAFMIKNKPQYMKLREKLKEIALKTKAPTDEQMDAAAKSVGAKFEQLNYSDVAMGLKYFKHLAKQFGVESTPTVVIVHADKKKGKKLIGASEITGPNILNAIDQIKKD